MRNFNLIKPEMLQYMVPMGATRSIAVKGISQMGRLRAVKNPLVKGSNYLRQADMPGVRAFQNDITAYASKLRRQAAEAYARKIKEQALLRKQQSFERAHRGFNIENMFSNYTNRLK